MTLLRRSLPLTCFVIAVTMAMVALLAVPMNHPNFIALSLTSLGIAVVGGLSGLWYMFNQQSNKLIWLGFSLCVTYCVIFTVAFWGISKVFRDLN